MRLFARPGTEFCSCKAIGIPSFAAAGAEAGAAVTLTNAPFYYTSVASNPSCYKSGVFYFYDGILVNGRYRITNAASRCGKLPVGQNVTGWVPASYCDE